MKLITIVLTFTLLQALARENVRSVEKVNIPEREDIEEVRQNNGKEEFKQRKKEVRQNQENTDPVFYDSTTSPKEMEGKEEED